jgi:hypothetical protein
MQALARRIAPIRERQTEFFSTKKQETAVGFLRSGINAILSRQRIWNEISQFN